MKPARRQLLRVCPMLQWLALTVGLALGGCNRAGFGDADEVTFAPPYLRFVALIGETVPTQPVAVLSLGEESVAWHARANVPWLILSETRGVTPSTLWLGVHTDNLAAGTYHGAVEVRRGSAVPSPLAVELVIHAPGWTSLQGPFGGVIVKLAAHPTQTDRILAADVNAVIFLSVDGGQSFVQTNTELNSRVTNMVLAENEVGYLATENDGVYRTDDWGITWALTALRDLPLSSVSIDPRHSDLVLAAGDELWRSDNGGVSWVSVPLASAPSFVMNDINSPAVVVVGGADGSIYRGDGTAFATIATPFAAEIDSFASLPNGRWLISYHPNSIPPQNYSAVAVSDDSGSSWRETFSGGQWNDSARIRLSTFNDTVYLTTARATNYISSLRRGAAVSHDGGESFVRLTYDFVSAANGAGEHRDAALIRPDGSLLLPSYGEGVLSNAGSETPDRLHRVQLFAHTVVDFAYGPADGTLLVALSSEQLFAYKGGRGFVGLRGEGAVEDFQAIFVDPRSSSVIQGPFWSWRTGFARTTDGGATWTETSTAMITSASRAFDDPDVFWLSTYNPNQIHRSVDNGQSWSVISSGGSPGSVLALSADFAVVVNNGGLERVEAATGARTVILDRNTYGSVQSLQRTLDGSWWIVADGTDLYRSHDSGSTYVLVPLSFTSIRSIVVHPATPERIYVATDTTLFFSSDNGQTWENLFSPFSVTELEMLPESEVLIVGTEGGGLYQWVP